RVFQADLYLSANLRSGRLRCVSRCDNYMVEQEEDHAGDDALAAQAQAFLGAIHGEPGGVDGESATRVLALAQQVGTLVRERLGRTL
ncbi:MAG TPA: hypothetical protein VD838_13045, partial [Anaeromyxobacteraceae bacterium]|nr:hypothetical protein [Anaeromyxobacteraceae bacterium]